MVEYIKSDLAFILKQIKIAEAHAAGQPLYGVGGLIPAYNLAWGLRTVDGSNNHLLPGQEKWGAADVPFPTLLDPSYRPADGTLFDPDGPGGAPAMPTQANYNPSNNPNSLVFDASLRTISNLLVDQTLGNPAAVLEALKRAGSLTETADLAAITAIYRTFKPASDAEFQARVVQNNAQTAANQLGDGDPATPPTPAEQEALDALAAATLVHDAALVTLAAARVARDAAVAPFGLVMDGDNVELLNNAPDGGLSAPFNSWFTLFGQFFDHGLDLVNKGGSGTVFVPLQPDDPLYVPGSHTNFMVLTRATVALGLDGVMGTADDVRPVNTTTAYVDQNQTYSSHASHQVFLRQYVLDANDRPVSTGHLIEGGGDSPGGMATWGEVKAQAKMLGILLTDADVGNVPLLRTDQYGKFIPNAAGYAQVIVGLGSDGIPNTADDVVISGTAANPVALTAAVRIGHAFLADIAHDAVPLGKIADGDITIGLGNPGNGSTEYDNELLDAHFIAGDGRVNENIGLTAVHHVFHAEHNRLVEHTKAVTLADARAMVAAGSTPAEAVAFLNEWLAVDVTTVPTVAQEANLVWDGERLFQAAKFGTEMQYQHLVFEEFARKIQPQIDFFVVPDGFDTTINPDIVAEFAHVVYRFGHSMLNETIERFDPTFTANDISLIDGFLNPIAFNGPNHAIADGLAAGDIIRGMTRQVGNQIDEFVTSALRNNLLGLPLDLATINLARGRDTGVPSLNAARRDFYEMSNENAFLKPYESWVEFAGNLKNEASIINFVAAYGEHDSITGEATVEGKRAAAMAIIFGVDQTILDNPATPANEARTFFVPTDAADFLNSTGAWANLAGGVTITGLDAVDLWIGGLAEKIMPFGGMLGSTFNFVFETQMENLQNGDRFYYLQRLDGTHLFSEMEGNSFGAMISRNTDARHLPSDVFSTPGLILEVDRLRQFNDVDGNGTLESDDPTGGGILTPLVVRNNPATAGVDTNYLRYTGDQHVVLGGTEGADTLISSEGDDTIFGDGGNDTIDGGAGNDIINAGDGDDVVRDLGGDDNIKLGAGNDVINTGPGLDLVLAGKGQDFIVLGTDAGSEVFAGEGNDFILGNLTAERILGNEGDDWIEHGTFDGAPGDNFDEIFAQDGVNGHDVFFGLGGFDEFIAEGGDDIMVGSPGRAKMAGMSGWDWAIYKDNAAGTDADLTRAIVFDENPTPPPNGAQDAYEAVEGLSGSRFDDRLTGSDMVAADRAPFDLVNPLLGGSEGFLGSNLNAAGIARIAGLQAVLGTGVSSYNAGDIILGGDGNDVITGRGGDDIIDGDKWLNVRISVRANVGPNGGTGAEIDSADSMTELVTQMFNRTYNPGQLQIVREILTANGTGDVDVAVFSGPRADYDLIANANGSFNVNHARGTQIDGNDNIRNIERLRFSDMEIGLPQPATGAPVISDLTPTEGFALTASTAAIADANGLGAFSYQWQSSANGTTWTNIAGATGASFTPDDNLLTSFGDQAGLQLRLAVSFTDGAGTLETVVSAATGPVGVNWDGIPAFNNTLNGTAGNDIADGVGPIVFFGGGNDTLNGNAGDDDLDGAGGNDVIAGGAGNDLVTGSGGTDTAVFTAGAGNYNFALAGGNLVVNDLIGTNGTDTLSGIETVRFSGSGGSNYALVNGAAGGGTSSGGNANDLVLGHGGNDTLNGNAGADILVGGAGNDTLNGGAGTDLTLVRVGDGRDFIDGGANTDTVHIAGDATAEHYRIYTRVRAISDGVVTAAQLNATTDIVITRNGVTNGSVVAELDNIEEIVINGRGGGDTFTSLGNFAPTSLSTSTITLEGSDGDETIDISALESAHRIMFRSAGGNDTIIGTLRPDDVIELPVGAVAADYVLTSDGLGNSTLTSPTHTIHYTSAGQPRLAVAAVATNAFFDDSNGVYYYGDSLTGDDEMDGGDGADVMALQGDYDLVLNAGLLTNIETLALLTSKDMRFGGGSATELFGYAITTTDENVVAGGKLIVNASSLTAGENMTLNGSAETDGMLFVYGGKGVDTITGGGTADVFFFAEDSRFAIGDRVNGGGGNDIIVLRGRYDLTFASDSFVGVETVVLNTASDLRYSAAGTNYSYRIVTHDANVAAGGQMTYNGGRLGATEILTFDGSAELDGRFRLFGGAANDSIHGGAGGDSINAGAGDDLIRQSSFSGGDLVDGGEGLDTYELTGSAEAETFTIYSRDAAMSVMPGLVLAANTEIVITRNGTVIAQLDNIEEIHVNSLGVTTPGGSAGGTVGGDTIQVVGDFTGTSLNFNTITIDGGAAGDTVDISALMSAHRVVFRSNGGQDTVVGTPRPQDVFDVAATTTLTADASLVLDLQQDEFLLSYATKLWDQPGDYMVGLTPLFEDADMLQAAESVARNDMAEAFWPAATGEQTVPETLSLDYRNVREDVMVNHFQQADYVLI